MYLRMHTYFDSYFHPCLLFKCYSSVQRGGIQGLYYKSCPFTSHIVHLVPTAEGGSISQQMEANVLPTGQAVQCGSLQSAHETTHEKNSQL